MNPKSPSMRTAYNLGSMNAKNEAYAQGYPKFNYGDWMTGAYQVKLQNWYNKQNSLDAYQRDVAMWNLENEYNSPRSQMERYQAAGLNPNLIYSQGTPGNSTGTPKFNAPEINRMPSGMETLSKLMGVAQGVTGLMGNMQQIAVAKATAKKIATETDWIDRIRGAELEQIMKRTALLSEQAFGAKLKYRPFNAIDRDPLKVGSWYKMSQDYPWLFNQYPSLWDNVSKEREVDNLIKYQSPFEKWHMLNTQQQYLFNKNQNNWFNLSHFNTEAGKILGGALKLLLMLK